MDRSRISLLAASAVLLLGSPARANDSTATMAAGGLVLTRTDGIEMRSEDLFVSVREVRVAYRFRNITNAPITTIVAFPMPTIDGRELDGDIAIPTNNPTNLLDFRTSVNGQAVRAEVEQKAMLDGVDHTARLRQLGVPLAPHLPGAAEALARLAPARRAELERLGLIEPEFVDNQTDYRPLWSLQTTWFWTQTFPPARDVEVRHSYTPAAGGLAGTMVGERRFMASATGREYVDRYCIDDAFLAAVNRAAQGREYPPFSERWIEYVLRTGANWSGPIGDFRLVVDKGNADNLVSFCGSRVRRLDRTRFEVRYSNYTPTRDLSILILERMPRPQE